MTKKKTKTPPAVGRPRIFVQIASYRDRECQHTVKDLFEKAKHPERIFVGICWQFDEKEDAACFEVPYPRPEQVRVVEYHYRDSIGANWARAEAAKLLQDEEYTLAIDAHMRFEKGWDEELIAMLAECDSPRPMITNYPASYEPPDTLDRGYITRMCFREFEYDPKGKLPPILRYKSQRINMPEAPKKPFAAATVSNNFMFAPSELFRALPIDPHIYFFGDDLTYAARVWTHGWDIFSPHKNVVYHLWDRKQRRGHWDDHTHRPQDVSSRLRCAHIVGMQRTQDPEALKEIEKYDVGTTRSMADYQAFCGVDFARKTLSEAAMKGEFSTHERPQIFVRIASYRDSECQWTVKDLFEKATHPERIFVGICWQFDEKEDAHCFAITTRPEQVRVYPVDWRESDGVCWARSQTEMLMEQESYTLQIDSHMRFTPGWDEALIAELALCPSKKPVLSCGPATYTPPDHLDPSLLPTVRTLRPFGSAGNIRGRSERLDTAPEMPLRGVLIAAGFVFSRSDLVREVPYDPYLYFDQEEIMYSLRLYTHGWDVYVPRMQLLYHFYNVGEETAHPLHWRDLKAAGEAQKIDFLAARGLARLNHLTGYKPSSDSRTLIEIEKYGMGKMRSIADFESFVGVDFKKKNVHPKAQQGGFIARLDRFRHSPISLAPAAGSPETLAAPFDVGDMMPYFIAQDTSGNRRAIEKMAGSPILLFFLPSAEPQGNTTFFRALDDAFKAAGKPHCYMFFLLDDTVENLVALKEKHKLPHILWADPGSRIGQSLGVRSAPSGFLLGPSLHIKKRYTALPPAELAGQAIGDLKAMDGALSKPKKMEVISETAPVLIVPEVFSPDLCDELIEAFRKGNTFQGEVGSKGYVSTAKVREDFIVPDDLRAKIDLKLSRSLFPEIEKIFGFKVAARENYKIGVYRGDKAGFFAQHRDNFDEAMGYRRVAMTLHLSDDYEGGGLRFPEYDDRTYRPARGSAIVFSGSALHEACKVTKGERFVLIGFMHGEEEEAYRQHYAASQNQPLQAEAFVPLSQSLDALERSRDFYRRWKEQRTPQAPIAAPELVVATPPPLVSVPAFAIGAARHQPVKVFESRAGVVYDNFLPDDVYEKLRSYAVTTDYEHINTKGKISRAWHVHDGFPLRSVLNGFYHHDKSTIPVPKPPHIYPTATEFDRFMEYMLEFGPQVERYTGKPGEGWKTFSVTAWIYPPGTGLSMHDDGSGVYAGAYAFFLNNTWRAHWGGLLVMMDDVANDSIHAHRRTVDQSEYHRQKWLHVNNSDDLMVEHGLARCIFPKGNRMVFIANDAYHMVTRVNEAAGDNYRLSLAGFFGRKN
ncbi:MAG: GlcNAc-transferase family protein [Alphaproteobacteria bacterium]|nr:GlcNAc-transferase family protein [Alphaproteobacteria bacterium]